MREFFRCVAEAIAENGVKGLAKMVPGGEYIYDVSAKALKKYKERRDKQKQHDDFLKLASAKIDEAREEAVKVVQEVFAAVPVGAPAGGTVLAPASPEELEAVGLYLTAIPEALRQSLKRADDVTGTTLPAGFDLREADDVVRVLPPRPPRFRAGEPLPGKPEWLLDRLLGMGGFGEVWYAKHPRMSALGGAVKFCFGQTGRDLVHEAELIDRVMQAGTHPNIVPLRDVCLEGEAPWLMFEYIGGGCLTDWIHQLAGTAPDKRLTQVVAAIKQLASAVGFFHSLSRPVVHRDLKPSNVLLDTATKKLRITDFGIGAVTARETNRQESRGHSTRGGRLLSYLRGSHTPLYSSPQQRTGADPDPRDDVHALGVIAYQMCTGKLDAAPGPGGSRALKRAGLPDDLAELILRCASEELEDRPTDANELLTELNALSTASAPAVTAPVPATPTAPKPVAPIAAIPVVPKPVVLPKPGERMELTLPGGVTMPFAYCPPGEFLMGSPASEKDRSESELQHRVVISKGFWMGVSPVTQAQWQAVMKTNPSHFKGETRPVECVSWDDAQTYCQALNSQIGSSVRLPTEAEWEYACRGGTTTPFYFGSQLNGTQANIDGNYPYGTTTKGPYLQETTPVGAYAAKFPHPWGLCDVHGNVWEWCLDWYDEKYYSRSSTTDPRCDDCEQKYRIVRGGSWNVNGQFCLAADRDGGGPAYRLNDTGFRLLVPFDPAQENSLGTPAAAEKIVSIPTRPVAPKPVAAVPPRVTPEEPSVVPATPVVPKPVVQPKAGERMELTLPGGVKMPFAYCPPGEFLMGSPKSEKDRQENELQHRVVISKGFWMGVSPVTQAQWQAVMKNNPSHFKGNTRPVETVSWFDAWEYCQALKLQIGAGVLLPTEAEWEYACRGGTTTPFYFGTQLNGTQANIDGNYPYGTTTEGPYLKETTPVGAYAAKFPHPWGLYDVHGNVWEWCFDWYDENYYSRSPTTDPRCDDGEQNDRVVRGGAWSYFAFNCRTAYRSWNEPANRYYFYGFRLLLPSSSVAPAFTETEIRIRKPQAKVLALLARATTPLTRQEISVAAGVDLAWLTEWLGSEKDDIRAKNDKKFLSLISLGFVSSARYNRNGKTVVAYTITDTGIEYVKNAKL